jgi:thiosulfate/3-mercaptopyruvate sulfurtransferase
MNNLVSTNWLLDHLGDPDIIILDASMAAVPDYENQIILGAQKFDIKGAFSDQSIAFPNTFPTAEQFEEAARALGIKNDSKVVVYDNKGVYSSARVWWMFKTAGHESVAVLDGGLPDWVQNDYPTATDYAKPFEEGNIEIQLKASNIKLFEEVEANAMEPDFLIVDARSKGRFEGTSPEPRAQLQSGCIPHSANLPFTEVLEGGKFKRPEELALLFQKVNPNNKELVFSCGSGITACIILFARELIEEKSLLVYDGSWTEWAEKQGLTQ